jgi:DNA-binding MarR family transcriptional regulator
VSLSQATVTAILDRLQKQGFVTRERNEQDRRQVLVHLTDKAAESLAQAPELLQAGFLREFGGLAVWEQNMLIASLQRIAELMDAEDIEAGPILETGPITPPDESG